MPRLVFSLLAFAFYTISLILLTGPSFGWKETKKTFYLGGRSASMFLSLSTFCATWMSSLSLVAYSMWFYRDGYMAFIASVNGWMLGLLFFPFIVGRLRSKRALSLPEWIQKSFGGDIRVRKLVAATMVFLYLPYLVIQFRSFGVIISSMLQIRVDFVATALIYLFVLYTTFGGYLSVVKSDVLNWVLITFGVTFAAFCALRVVASVDGLGLLLSIKQSIIPKPHMGLREYLSMIAIMLTWGLGVACNPQYAVRIIACRSKKDAYKMIALAPFFIGWIYFAITVFIACTLLAFPMVSGRGELLDFARLASLLSPVAESALLIAVIAAAVSTANSQLLLASCAICYDLFPPRSEGGEKDPLFESRFLFFNRMSIAVIASIALVLSQLQLPDILMLGQFSWTLVVGCFFFPLFVPGWTSRKYLFHVLAVAVLLQFFIVLGLEVGPEYGMIFMLFFEAAAFGSLRFTEKRAAGSRAAESVK